MGIVRDKVKKIIPVDMHLQKPTQDLDCKYDVITSSLCLEVAATTTEEHATMVTKLADMLNPRGYLVLVGVLGQSYFRVGDYRFSGLQLSSEDIKRNITSAGFEISFWRESSTGDNSPLCQSTEYSDFRGMFAVAAQKTV